MTVHTIPPNMYRANFVHVPHNLRMRRKRKYDVMRLSLHLARTRQNQVTQATPFAKGVACETSQNPFRSTAIAFSMRHAERKGSGLRDYSTACGSSRYGYGGWIVVALLVDAHQLHASWRTDIVLTLRY